MIHSVETVKCYYKIKLCASPRILVSYFIFFFFHSFSLIATRHKKRHTGAKIKKKERENCPDSVKKSHPVDDRITNVLTGVTKRGCFSHIFSSHSHFYEPWTLRRVNVTTHNVLFLKVAAMTVYILNTYTC